MVICVEYVVFGCDGDDVNDREIGHSPLLVLDSSWTGLDWTGLDSCESWLSVVDVMGAVC